MANTLENASHFAGLRIPDENFAAVLAGTAKLVEDGAMGTMLQSRGLSSGGQAPDLLNLSSPDDIREVHAAYVNAGAELVITNTFGACSLKLGDAASVGDVYRAAVANARAAGARYVAGDIGPTGEMLDPYGDLEEDEAYDIFAEQARAARDAGCDLIAVETMTDLNEAKLAVSAARAETNLPIFATMAFQENGHTIFGATPEQAAETLVAAGANAIGVNCSLSPEAMRGVVQRFVTAAKPLGVPIIAKPNAGLPHLKDGITIYDVDPEDFAAAMADIIDDGATIVGGCCGTDERFIKALAAIVDEKRS